MRRWTVWACLGMLVFNSAYPAAPANAPARRAPGDEVLRVFAEGYLSNYEAFRFLTCRFQKREGKAADLNAALQGRLTDTVDAEITWIVNGPKVKHFISCDKDSVNAALARVKDRGRNEQSRTQWAPCATTGILTDGGHLLNYSHDIAGANIMRTPGGSHPHVTMTPFSMGIMGANQRYNPGKTILKCLNGEQYGVHEGTEMIEGVKLAKVSIGQTREKLFRTYWMDPDRGFLPIRIEGRGPNPGAIMYLAVVKEVKACSKGRWFPAHSIVIDDAHLKGVPLRVREFKVLELDVDNPPKDEAFSLDIAAGTQISEPANPQGPSFFTLKAEERIYAHELDKLLQRCRSYIPYWNNLHAEVEAFKAEEAKRLSPWVWFGLLNAGLFAFLGVIASRKWWTAHRSRASSGGSTGQP